MPLAENGSLIAAGLEVFGNVGEPVVKMGVERGDTVNVIVCAGEDGGTARAADGIGDVAMLMASTFVGDAVNIRGAIDPMPIATDGLAGVIIAKDKYDVGTCHVLTFRDFNDLPSFNDWGARPRAMPMAQDFLSHCLLTGA